MHRRATATFQRGVKKAAKTYDTVEAVMDVTFDSQRKMFVRAQQRQLIAKEIKAIQQTIAQKRANLEKLRELKQRVCRQKWKHSERSVPRARGFMQASQTLAAGTGAE